MIWSELITELDERLDELASSLADPDDHEVAYFDDLEFPETPVPPQLVGEVATLLDRVSELEAAAGFGLEKIGSAIHTTPLIEAANRAYLNP